MLGLSGASFLFGALNDWHYYVLGGLFLAVGLFFYFRGQPVAVSLEGRQRNKWFFPLVMVGTAGVAYLAITLVISPSLISASNPAAVSSHNNEHGLMAEGNQKEDLWRAGLRVEGMA
jgi:hypothetical protein